ncbi:MAG TPA: hypothetical protein VHM25_22975 [Polyangiaceae bacterium]|jgi:hypothetical protein|nr:hypothetical protein [Polyangiaceae bacterium]
MRREANIPLFLWITTAVVVHLLWSGGADQTAKIIEQRLDIQRFARSVQNHVRGVGAPIEVTFPDEEKPPEKEDEQEDPDKPEDVQEPEKKNAEKDDPEAEKKPPLKDVVKPEPKVEPPKVEPKKPEEKKPEEKKAEPATPAQPPPELTIPKKIAVRQVVEDEKQPDNPNANFIADKANHVAQETQARLTSNDQNDAKPTPGGEHSSPDKTPGDADHSRVMQSEDKPGEKDHAPSEKPASSPEKLALMRPPAAEPAHQRSPAPAQDQTGARTGAERSPTSAPAQEGQKAQAESKQSEASPDVVNAENGRFTVPGPRQAMVDQAEAKARKARPLPKRHNRGDALFGFGSTGTTANGINLNLAPRTAVAAIGSDQLARERQIDGERRRSAHVGSWHPMDPSRWRSAIENYVPSVQLGNQTALNTAASAFGSYLSMIHNRIHPIFADSFLGSLDNLPAGHPMNNKDLSTEVEIVLDQESGNVVRMGVTKFSGITAFDIAALDSVKRAAPFGTPPREIVSPDGKVYLHWEFHRNEYACSTLNARPFLLKAQPGTAPTEVTPPPAPSDPTETSPRERHGQNTQQRDSVYAQN